MKDRVPTQVVNGAVRMEQLDASGNSLGYLYLKRADEPSEEGTPFNKNSMLKDATAEAIGLDPDADPTPDDAFAKIADTIKVQAKAVFPLTFDDGGLTGSKTFTFSGSGLYRITIVAPGGDGAAWNNYYSGGAGGSGGIAEVVVNRSAGDTAVFSVTEAGVCTFQGIAECTSGKAGTVYSSGKTAAGGTGGTAKLLGSVVSSQLYSGNKGQNGGTDGTVPLSYTSVRYGKPYCLYEGSYCHPHLCAMDFGRGGKGDGSKGGRWCCVIEYLGGSQ